MACRDRPITLTVLALMLMTSIPAPSRAGLSYYIHLFKGGFELLQGRKPIEKVLADPETEPQLRSRLEVALSAREFASQTLLLPRNKSYRSYKDVGRPFASWAVVAAPELSLQPIEWCFPIAGCVSYRGYFSSQKAEKFAEKLRRRGYDVDVGGVRAYSSLGWFADPVLNTFLSLRDFDLAGLIFHELAHQKLYVKGDTAFNEAFATTVEIEGVRRWVEERDDPDLVSQYRSSLIRERQWISLARRTRTQLEDVYKAAESDDRKRELKAEILDGLRQQYLELAAADESWVIFDEWFGAGLNNARLLAIAAYHDYEPALQRVLARCDFDLSCFYAESATIAEMSQEERSTTLGSLLQAPPISAGTARPRREPGETEQTLR
ncbi:MAG: aminopeptidase [Acidobacteriota bacterium]